MKIKKKRRHYTLAWSSLRFAMSSGKEWNPFIPEGIPIRVMEDQPIRVMDMHAIVEEAGGKAVFVKTYVPLYGENRTEVYDGVVKMDADGNVITKQKITAREGYQFPPATLDFEAFHTKILDKVLSEVRAKIAMNPDPVISGFVSPPTTNPFMHECQGYIPARVPRWWRHHRHHRHRRHRLGEGDENYDVPSEPIPARELVYTASPRFRICVRGICSYPRPQPRFCVEFG